MISKQAPKILIVDDEKNIRHMLGLLLRGKGYDVREASNGQQALRELLAVEFAIVLCDVRMPKLDGLGLLKELKNRRVETTVIMMSAYGHIDTAIKAIQAGAYDYIAKPFKADEILLTLKKAEERRKLRRENAELRKQARGINNGIIARSKVMMRVLTRVDKVAKYHSTVLISGESGTGKELIAQALHEQSGRKHKPMVTINCGAIPENLLESELFGHVKGAFTDAIRNRIGLFEEANHGTLFLDEIDELPKRLQVKLLRVLQESEIRSVGSSKSRKIDVRVIAASNDDLNEEVKKGRFREDLFYRLNVIPIVLPPLRERAEDIPILLEYFIEKNNKLLCTRIRGIAPRAMNLLSAYSWPGNVRELQNIVERAMILSETDVIEATSLPEQFKEPNFFNQLLAEDELSIKKSTIYLEKVLIKRALKKTKGNRTKAALLLEISLRSLIYKLKEYYPKGLKSSEIHLRNAINSCNCPTWPVN